MSAALHDERVQLSISKVSPAEGVAFFQMVDGLADALELSQHDLLSISFTDTPHARTGHINLKIHNGPLSNKKVDVVASWIFYRVELGRSEIAERFLNGPVPANVMDELAAAQEIVSGGMSPSLFVAPRLLHNLLRASDISFDQFIAGMKGHRGQFRTHEAEQEWDKKRRRNRLNTLFPVIGEIDGHKVNVEKIAIEPGNATFVRYDANKTPVRPELIISQKFPEVLAASMIGQKAADFIDSPQVQAVLGDCLIEEIIPTGPIASRLVLEPEIWEHGAMNNGALAARKQRLVVNLQKWAAA